MDISTLCPCCGDRNFKVKDNFEICPVCGWIDDVFQRTNSDCADGKNKLSLNASRLKWEAKKMVAVANNYRST